MGLVLVVNLHGAINSPGPVRTALEELKVIRKFSASVVSDDPPTMGMLKLCKERVAWATVDQETLAGLLKKRGMVSGTKALDVASLKTLGFKSHEELAGKMVKDQLRLSAIKGVRPFFRLAPPKGGFNKSLRRQASDNGIMGENPALFKLVERMA